MESSTLFFGENSTEISIVDLIISAEEYIWYNRVGIIAGGALAGAVLLPLLVPFVLCVFGFTCWGIRAGSAAACCQSNIGNVKDGSCFSCLQSYGAGGCGKVYIILLAITGAILGGYIAYLATGSSASYWLEKISFWKS